MINNEFIDRTDKDILDEIKKKLNMDEDIAEELDSINITVENNIVRLEGTVSSLELKDDIQDNIEDIPGVAQIINDLQIEKI
jgi:osmotically-inducible protein OsmY